MFIKASFLIAIPDINQIFPCIILDYLAYAMMLFYLHAQEGGFCFQTVEVKLPKGLLYRQFVFTVVCISQINSI